MDTLPQSPVHDGNPICAACHRELKDGMTRCSNCGFDNADWLQHDPE